MVSTQVKRQTVSLAVKTMQLKMLNFLYLLSQTAKITSTDNALVWQGDGTEFLYTVMRDTLIHSSWELVWHEMYNIH